MKHSRKLTLFASFLILTIFIGACGSMTKEDNKEAQIKKVSKNARYVSYQKP